MAELEIPEDDAVKCDFCSGETIDLIPVGDFRVCLECVWPKKECA